MNKNNDHKQMIAQGFDTASQGYDHPSLSFFPETAKRMVEHLAVKPDQTLLDVCTGTGVVALAAAEQLSQGRVTGIDLSSGMLQQAKDKAEDRKLYNTDFIQMDLDQLEFPAESFDMATSSFGLFFLEDMTKGLTNIANSVKPGGKIAISTFTGSAFSPMVEMFYKRYESTGRTLQPASWKRLATHEQIEEQFNAVNISKLTIHHVPLGYQMTSAEMWWDVIWNAGWRSLINQMSDEEQKSFKQTHMNEVSDVIGEEGVWFNTEVLIAVGEKPR